MFGHAGVMWVKGQTRTNERETFTVMFKDLNQWLGSTHCYFCKLKQHFWVNATYRVKIEILTHSIENINPSVLNFWQPKLCLRRIGNIHLKIRHCWPQRSRIEVHGFKTPHNLRKPKTLFLFAGEFDILTRNWLCRELINLLNPFWNHWLSLQCDWLSAVRFIHESHYLLL